ncbi:MAG: 50S ribosomal protein L19 [Parcubacteria group bacterium GW2011_GWA2_56_7]|nr:MAG: 50S ribosomal protein L19 [Parcubacteria group bacterium GW2011_GWA2_56_7]
MSDEDNAAATSATAEKDVEVTPGVPAQEPETTSEGPSNASPIAETSVETTADPELKLETDVLEEATNTDREVEIIELPHRDIKPGMVVRVHEIIKDMNAKGEERERVQVFEGMVLGLRGSDVSRTMTIRRVNKGYGVEKIYPLASPHIKKIEVVRQFKVRRAKLGFLRGTVKRGVMKKRFGRKLKEVKRV